MTSNNDKDKATRGLWRQASERPEPQQSDYIIAVAEGCGSPIFGYYDAVADWFFSDHYAPSGSHWDDIHLIYYIFVSDLINQLSDEQ